MDRSDIMRAVKSKNTKPELLVRKIVTALGGRYRLHRKDIPGNPDLAFISARKAIFVHGCFWHGHFCKRGARMPKSNAAYWKAKIGRNVARDAANAKLLEAERWNALTVWECELRDIPTLKARLRSFLKRKSPPSAGS